MPKIPSGNTNAPVIMVGEKGADLVKQYWYGYSKRRRRSITSDEYKVNWPQKLVKSSSLGPKDHEILSEDAKDYSEPEEDLVPETKSEAIAKQKDAEIEQRTENHSETQ